MHIIINAIESYTDILDCMAGEKIRLAMLDDEHIGMLSELILHS